MQFTVTMKPKTKKPDQFTVLVNDYEVGRVWIKDGKVMFREKNGVFSKPVPPRGGWSVGFFNPETRPLEEVVLDPHVRRYIARFAVGAAAQSEFEA